MYVKLKKIEKLLCLTYTVKALTNFSFYIRKNNENKSITLIDHLIQLLF